MLQMKRSNLHRTFTVLRFGFYATILVGLLGIAYASFETQRIASHEPSSFVMIVR